MRVTKTAFCILLYFFGFISVCKAQVPETFTSADIYLQLKKLNVLGSVLYIAAHPDDENNGFLPYLAKERMYRTGYLSLTRGDGGQNLIGNEQGIELGLIRSQELIAARRVDGAEQFFSSAYEFGFSKNANEALSIWDKEKVLADIVYVIRKFQPDILITRFPGDARAGHGHHWASALLANEAYVAAADPNKFPEQFKVGVKPWHAKRIIWNGFNFGGGNNTTGPVKLDVGGFDPLLGKSSGDLGGEARSMHKSQGEGRPRRKGEIIENFVTTGGDTARNDIMEGIVTDWTRITGGESIRQKITDIIKAYNFEHPENSVAALLEVYKNINSLGYNEMWKQQKLDEVKNLIVNCAGIFAEATTREEFVLKGDTATVTATINKRNNGDVKLRWVGMRQNSNGRQLEETLNTNQNYSYEIKNSDENPPVGSLTQPYWLQLQQTPGNFLITNPMLVGQAWNDALMSVTFDITINGVPLAVKRPVQYKYIDPVKGEVYQPFIMIPHLSISMSPHVALLNVKTQTHKYSADSIYITYKSNFTKTDLPVTLYVLQDTARAVFKKELRSFEKGKSYTIALPIKKYYNPKGVEYLEAAIRFNLNGRDHVYSQYFKSIEYDHIPNIHYSVKDHIRVVNEEIKTVGKKVGYINGAGDRIPDALREMGFEVKILNEADITDAGLQGLDAVVIGIRAHNIYEYLSDKNDVLNNYVKNGGNLIAQYIKSNTVGLKRLKLGPYPFSISAASRVTVEDAPVNFLLPQHSALNYPNKITNKDFEGWVQERSTYQVDQADPAFEMPLSMSDPNEKAGNGSLAIAKYGKGNFAYVSLVLFRQLPAGIPGAFKILANLVALPKNE
jgi:LmbE family N-acetylglucosaminyl deacetylase